MGKVSSRDRWLVFTYAATIFVSAFLLFQIQPLVSKRILPWFGGSPAVWTTCLLFFQTFLFAGYAYAHFSNRWLQPRQQAGVHVALIIVALLLLRVLPGERWEPNGNEQPMSRILLILTLSVGLPYFVLAATGPLLQAWFARSFPARVPYRLYALSNVGSLLALVSYPFFFEPTFDLPGQALLWSCGFIVYAGLCAYAAWRMGFKQSTIAGDTSRTERVGRASGIDASLPTARPPLWHYAIWLILSAFASIVLLSTTNHISTDIAAIPFLWIVPLALYLLTFIIAFDRPDWYRRLPVAVVVLASIYVAGLVEHLQVGEADWNELGTPGLAYSYIGDWAVNPPEFEVTTQHFLIANFAAMFAICLLCHGELVQKRPAARYLTSFYLMIAAGGALGGAFVTLVAPRIFKANFEWELSLLTACLLAIAIILSAGMALLARNRRQERRISRYALVGIVAVGLFLSFAVMLLDLSEFLLTDVDDLKWRARNFFGTLSIQTRNDEDDYSHQFVLLHGATTHGLQFTEETRRREPTTYYGPPSGVARVIDYFHRHRPAGGLRMGVVGLGTGTLAAYADAGESVSFYEINPAVIDVAERGPWFTFLRDCRERGARCDIRLGDARLAMRRELQRNQPQRFHVIALDAFSGDSIPVHLLTTQAFEMYLAHLSGASAAEGRADEDGAIAVHVSNRYIDLEPVVSGVARHFGLRALTIENDDDDENEVYGATWIILTRNDVMAAELAKFANPATSTQPTVLWTDSRSSLFEVLK